MIIKKSILPLFLFLLYACSDSDINVTLPDTGQKLVVNGFLANDSMIGLNIYKSNKLGIDTFSSPEATVKVYKDGTYIGVFYNSTTDRNTTSDCFNTNSGHLSTVYPTPGSVYRFEVSAEGLPTATASAEIPAPVKIEKLDTSLTVLDTGRHVYEGGSSLNTNFWTTYRVSFSFSFTDPPEEENYYMGAIYCRDISSDSTLNWYWEATYEIPNFEITDPCIEFKMSQGDGSDVYSYIIPDIGFNGKVHKVTGVIGNMIAHSDDFNEKCRTVLYFRLYSISKEFYKYLKSVHSYNKDYANPLAEPVNVFSNIQNGYGILGAAGVSCDSVDIKPINFKK